MAGIGCSIVSPPRNPYEQKRTREIIKNERRERELEQKWKDDSITKFEAVELAARKIAKVMDTDTYIKH